MDDTCRRVLGFLRSKFRVPDMTVSTAWIEGCVDWYKSSNNSSNNQAMLDFVAQQWLLIDFEHDFQMLNLHSSLPSNLSEKKVITIAGNHILQMQHMLNIGQSAYSQHLKITKGQESNTEVSADRKIPSKWEPKGKRMLQLKLTDGAQVIQAIEEVLIPQLHLDLIPGTKMLLKGPLECRRGVVILKPSNVELLGGEVSDLVGINAPENVLARIIGKAENPNPVYGSYSMQTANVEADQHDEADEFVPSGAVSSSWKERQQKRVFPDEHRGIVSPCRPTKKSQPDRPIRPPVRTAAPTAPVRAEDDFFGDDDNDLLLMDMPMPTEKEPSPAPPQNRKPIANHRQTTVGNVQPQPKKPSTTTSEMAECLADDDDDLLFMEIDIPSVETASTNRPSNPPPEKSKGSLHQPTTVQHSTLKSSVSINATSQPSQCQSSAPQGPKPTSISRPTTVKNEPIPASPPRSPSPSYRPFNYLKPYLDKKAKGESVPDTLCVKAFVSTLTSKLEGRKGSWRLRAVINDGSASIEVDFSNEVLENMIGYSVKALRSLMKSTKNDESSKQIAIQALENAKLSLFQLNCLLYIRWPSGGGDGGDGGKHTSHSNSGDETDCVANSDRPVVCRLEEIERRHLEMLDLI